MRSVCVFCLVCVSGHDPCDSPSPLSVFRSLCFPICSSPPPLIVPTLGSDHSSHPHSPLFPVGAPYPSSPGTTTCRSPAHLLLFGKPLSEKDVRHWQCSDILSSYFHFSRAHSRLVWCLVGWFGLLAVLVLGQWWQWDWLRCSKQKAGSPSRAPTCGSTPTLRVLQQLQCNSA